ncbi:MAG TPA: hypothetical protein VKB50_16850 [Vicinamibacterales bacterium]|nr:hypothetical protein [Vicinamibacterales bacterium]
MARIDWAVLCDSAFLDRDERLCLIGIIRSLSVPTVPLTVHQTMMVAHLTDIEIVDEIAISVGMVSATGRHAAWSGADTVRIDMAGEYVLVTLRSIQLLEEGPHRFQIRLRGQPVVSIEIPVVSVGRAALADMH